MKKVLLRAAEIAAGKVEGAHPWNPASGFRKSSLSRVLGMSRAIVIHMTLPPGRESFLPHTHEREEEWIYILSGSGTALIDGEEVSLGPGDFMGFPAPSVVHHLRNDSAEDLVYLMGGEALPDEASDFPTLGLRKVRIGGETRVYRMEDGKD